MEDGQVGAWHLVVVAVGVGAQDRAAERMVGVEGVHVLAGQQGVDVRPGFRLGERVRARATLVGILPPAVRVLAVHVEAVEGTRYLPLESIVVLENAFFVKAVVRPPELVRGARDQEPGVSVRDAPLAILVLDAHLEDVAVAVHVVGLEAGFGLRFGPGPEGGAQGVGRGQVVLGAVGGETGEDVEGLLVEEAGYEVVPAVALQEGLDQIQRRHRAGHLARVGVAVHPEGRFLFSGAGPGVGDLGQPDLPPLVAPARGLNPAQPGELVRERVQGLCELFVGQVSVEARLHGSSGVSGPEPGYYGPSWASECP